MVVDDFGDVFGIFLAVSGEGYSSPELRRYVEFLRRELLLVPGVKGIELFGEQQEVAYGGAKMAHHMDEAHRSKIHPTEAYAVMWGGVYCFCFAFLSRFVYIVVGERSRR